MGSALPYSIPRGVWPASDGQWVAVSSSSDSVAARVMALVGLGADDRLRTLAGRQAHRGLVEAAVADFIGSRTAAEVVAAFEAAQAAAAVVLDQAGIARDPQVVASGALVEVEGVQQQGLVARLSATPGSVRWVGRPLGADTDAVLAELDGPDGPDGPAHPDRPIGR